MNLYHLTENEMLSFILILIRIGTFFMVFPLFDQVAVPAPVKVLLSLVTTMVLFPVVGATPQRFLVEAMAWLTIKEMFIGFIMGYIAKLFFFILNIAGELITAAIGLSASSVFNPAFGSVTGVFERFQLYLGTLFFLALNAHHVFIKGLAESFSLISISQQTLNPEVFRDIALMGETILKIGFQLAAPVVGTIFILNLGMGIIGRAVPQINVLITSWSVNLLAGFASLIAAIPLTFVLYKDSFQTVAEFLFKVLKSV